MALSPRNIVEENYDSEVVEELEKQVDRHLASKVVLTQVRVHLKIASERPASDADLFELRDRYDRAGWHVVIGGEGTCRYLDLWARS